MAKYQCSVCGFIYDEEAEGKPFAELTECPVCKQPASVFEKIEAQQKKESGRTDAWMVGEQLKDICRAEPRSAELIDKDLDVDKMSIREAAKKIKAFADSHKTGSFACVTPAEADRILREFYGLGQERAAEGVGPYEGNGGKIISLEDFL